jgi:eukaryotic-like serine/threonine-protein kinase
MTEREHLVYEFGPFRLDTLQRLLFRGGELIPVSPKTLDTLIVLVKNHGQLIEKEQLFRLIWPGAFVEESNLAGQVSQLRKLLSEPMGSNPIETFPKRGYRFVAAVRSIDGSVVSVPQTTELPAPPAAPAAAELHQLPLPTRRRWLAAGIVVIGAAMLLSYLVFLRSHSTPAPAPGPATPLAPTTAASASGQGSRAATARLTARDSVLLADIQNETGDAVFDDTLRQALTIQLEQSPFLALVSDQQIQRSLGLMQRPKNSRLTPEMAWEVCQRTGSAAVIYGSIANLGNQYILGLRAVDCRNGDLLANRQTTAEGRDHVLQAVDAAATALRGQLGESLAEVQQYNTPIEEATTPSLPALEAYSLGWLMNYRKGDSAAALAFFERAVQLDPRFAMAYAALGQARSNLHEPGRAAQYLKSAYELRGRVSERERFYIESRYQRLVTGDLEQARLINQQWSQVYPRDALPQTSLALIDRLLGQYPRALTEAKRALQLSPDSAQSYANLSFSYLLLNQLSEVKAVTDEAQSKDLDSPLLRLDLYFLAFLQHDGTAAEQLDGWAAGQPSGVEDRFLEDKAAQNAYAGNLNQGLVLTRRAIAAALRSGAKEPAASYENTWALIQALLGNPAQARLHAGAALRLANDRETRYGSAMVFALADDPERARQLASSLDKEFPQDTAVQFCYLPTVRAVLALRRGDVPEALRNLEVTRPYELGKVTTLYPVYFRGLAYLAASQPREAAAEFQKIIDMPGVVIDDLIGVLAPLQRARALAMQGLTEQARAGYQSFLALWQAGEPSNPLLTAARAEYAQLK